MPIFGRRNERFDHFSIDEVAVELIQLRQPEFVAGVVSVGTAVRIAPQITEELHQHERAVEFHTEPSVIRPTARGIPSRSYQVINENSAERFRLISFGIFIAD